MTYGDGKCKWCGSKMKWARTISGRPIPLDPDPSEHGNVQLVNGIATVLGGLELNAAQESNEVLHISHFATCKSPFNPSNRRQRARSTGNEG